MTVHGAPRAGALRRARLRRHLARHRQQQPQGQGEFPPAAHHHRPLPPDRGPLASAPGRRGARRPPPPRRGERSGNFQGAEKAKSFLSKAQPRKQPRKTEVGGTDPRLKATSLGGGPGPPSLARRVAERGGTWVSTHSLRRQSKPTGSGYGRVELAPYVPPRPFQSCDFPLSPWAKGLGALLRPSGALLARQPAQRSSRSHARLPPRAAHSPTGGGGGADTAYTPPCQRRLSKSYPSRRHSSNCLTEGGGRGRKKKKVKHTR